MNNFDYYIPHLYQGNSADQTEEKRALYTNLYYGTLSNILLGVFEVENTSIELKKCFERSFFFSNYIGAYDLEETGLIIAPIQPNGNLNVYGMFDNYNLILSNKIIQSVDRKNLIIGCNYDMPTMCDSMLCWQYANRLMELAISIDNSIKLSRYSGLIVTPPNNARGAKQLFDDNELGVPIHIVSNFDSSEYKTLQFEKPTSVQEYYNGFRDVLNEFLTVTGLSSLNNPNKKERLLVDEINTNEDIKGTLIENKIYNRKKFIDEINKKYKTDIKLYVNSYIVSDFDNILQSVQTESNFFQTEK